jgi:hypothetical protein
MLMELDILSKEARFVSASEASEKTGYSADYIGQLCRGLKISGELVSRTWYVDLEALLEHKRTRQLGRRKKLIGGISGNKALGERKVYNQNPFLKDTFIYESDLRSNFPALLKGKKRRRISVFEEAVICSLLLVVICSSAAASLQIVSPKFVKKVEYLSAPLSSSSGIKVENALDSIILSGSIKEQIMIKMGKKTLQKMKKEYEVTLQLFKEKTIQ